MAPRSRVFAGMPAQDALFANTAIVPLVATRQAAIARFGGAPNTSDANARMNALLDVVQSTGVVQSETNRAFVLMEYFGYLRRNPNNSPEPGLTFSGYNFWLDKLNAFGSNFENAEMVKAFITSIEYVQRFGP